MKRILPYSALSEREVPEAVDFRILARAAARQLLREAFSEDGGPERVFMYTRPDNAVTCGFNRAMGFRPQAPEADAAPETLSLNWYGGSREEFLAAGQPE